MQKTLLIGYLGKLGESQRDGQKGELTRNQSYSQEDPTMITDSEVPF